MKSMAADVNVGDCLLDLGHVAGDALAAGASRLMVRVLLDARPSASTLTFPAHFVENLEVHDDCDAAVVRLYVYGGP